MKRIYVILFVLFTIIIGCGKNVEVDSVYKDITLGQNEIFLYSVVDEKLGIYNTKDFTWVPLYKEENMFQYVFDNDSKYIVSGNSINNGFVLLRISDDKKKIQKVFDLNDDESCFFPLSTNGKEYYFVMYEKEKSSTVKRNIFTFTDEFEINNVLKTNQMITSGKFADNLLYYTVYDSGLSCYKLYSIDLHNKKAKLIETNEKLETRDLFCYNERICVSDYDNIYCSQKVIKKEYINFIEQDYIIQFFANEDNEMVCTIKNISSENSMGTFLKPLNYEISNDTIKIYSKTGIYIVKL